MKRRGKRGWSTSAMRALLWQLAVLGVVGALVYLLVRNTVANLEARHVTTGFAFLGRVTGIPISGSLLDYDPAQSNYALAFVIGLVNTLRVWLVVAVAATIAGAAIGLARLSGNWLLRTLAGCYVEAVRNVPCLLQLLFWVTLIERLGPPDAASNPLPGVFLSNRGIAFPWIESLPTGGWAWSMPVRGEFDFIGGATMTAEFSALAIGLAVYGAAYVAEIVRAGVQSVPRGQWDAARAINLTPSAAMRWVILPQALRVILPPMTSQYLGMLKNSSLAIVLGYQDIVAIANLAMSQTGQAIECIALIMLVYLGVSVPVSLLMNWYNQRIAFGGRT